jgi:mannose-6-phosphate isomerase-like protein (cupin superfamily)
MDITNFRTLTLPVVRDEIASNGSDVRILLKQKGGSMAHFELPPGKTSKAVTYKTIDEIWYFISGHGEIWRKQNNIQETVSVEPGVCLTIPKGTHFQFRSFGYFPLKMIIVSMPPWPGSDESIDVKGIW